MPDPPPGFFRIVRSGHRRELGRQSLHGQRFPFDLFFSIYWSRSSYRQGENDKIGIPLDYSSPSAITLSLHPKSRIKKKSPYEYQGKPSQRCHFSKEMAIGNSYFVLQFDGDGGGIPLEKCDHFRLQKRLEFVLKSPFITGLLVYS
jgi:hypothetical protein